MTPRTWFTLICTFGLAGTAGAQQPLSLREALHRAETNSYGNRIAQAQADEQGAQKLAALRGILPTVRLEAGYARTTDPVGAFGTGLRQRRVTPADFEPQRLNYPDAVNNYTGAVVVEAPLLNVDAHIGRAAAASAGASADASAAWVRARTKVDVIRAYFGTVLAAEKTRTLEAALTAAEAHVRQAEQLVKAGLATSSDALLARVKAGEVETQLLEARGEVTLAREQLGMLLGEKEGVAVQLPPALPTTENVRALLIADHATSDTEARSDVSAARYASRAARLDVARATALYLPRLNGVARYDWNSATQVFGGDNNWTVGLMATWTPFAGGTEIAERQAARARAAGGEASLAAARAQAGLEVSRAVVDREVAVRRLDIAERGAQQSVEAHRIVARKYEGGLATVIEVLQASAGATQAQLALSYARYLGITAAAEELRARGFDPANLTDLLKYEAVGAQ